MPISKRCPSCLKAKRKKDNDRYPMLKIVEGIKGLLQRKECPLCGYSILVGKDENTNTNIG